jgi:hypothetical protein
MPVLSSHQSPSGLLCLPLLILQSTLATREATDENKSENRALTSFTSIHNYALIFPFIRLLVIYLFAGTLPTVHHSSFLLILPRQFFSSGIFRKALLDVFR